MASDARSPRRLASHLSLLAVATLIPFVLLAAVFGVFLVRSERQTFERGAGERVRAFSTAIDAEMRSAISTLLALAQARELQRDDLAAFELLARRVRAQNPEWRDVRLAHATSRRTVMSLEGAAGEARSVPRDAESFDAVVRTARPVIGNLRQDGATGRYGFVVRVPVPAGAAPRYVLSAELAPSQVQRMVDAQDFPETWVCAVIDREQLIAARSRAAEQSIGRFAADGLRQALSEHREGFFRSTTIDGSDVYTLFTTSDYTGWSVAIGVPTAVVDASAMQLAWTMLAGVSLALAAGLMLAQRFGHGLTLSIGALAQHAAAIARGTPAAVPPLRSRVAEVDALARGLGHAADAVGARDELQQRLVTVTGNATLALFMADAVQRCTYVNPAAEAMTGYGGTDLLGRTLHDVLHPVRPDGMPYPVEQCPMHAPAEDLTVARGEDHFVDRAGRFFPVSYTVSAVRRDGITVGSIVEVRDITEELRARTERAELLERERRLRHEAELANRAKDEFLAMLGHELRNPLGAIANATYVASAQPAGEAAARAHAIIDRQLGHLTRLVDDLLDAARVATGKIALVRAPVDLAAVAHRAAAALAGQATQHRVTLAIGPAWVDGDDVRLEQVVTNLVTNALRYTPAGGAIALGVGSDGTEAFIEVRDNGVGIAPELLPRIFEMFVQGARGLDRAQGGLGIGLTLVRRLVELHGGRLQAASGGKGQGSVFTVRLPAIAAPPAERAPSTGTQKQPDRGRRRVLVIEDNDDARDTMRVILELAGHDVRTCADGPAGVAAAVQWHPDVVLIDIGLPGTSGYDVARRIRAERFGAGALLVALTGYGQPEDRAASHAAGFDLHETKPVDIGALLDKIERWPAARDEV